jgi:hypothetical protein
MIACLDPRGADNAFRVSLRRTGGMLGHDALSMHERGVTLHGFRSTFSTWAEEQDDGRAYPRAVIKAALKHGKGDVATAAYLGSGLFEARRKLMERWSRFATGRSRQRRTWRGVSDWYLDPLTLNQRIQGSSPCAPTRIFPYNQSFNAKWLRRYIGSPCKFCLIHTELTRQKPFPDDVTHVTSSLVDRRIERTAVTIVAGQTGSLEMGVREFRARRFWRPADVRFGP